MKKIITLLILLSFATPVRAGMIMEYDTLDKDQGRKKQLEEDMGREFKKQAETPAKPITGASKPQEESGSNWWKWTLGIVLVGGVAAAAGGGGGGGGSSPSGAGTSGGSGTITGTW